MGKAEKMRWYMWSREERARSFPLCHNNSPKNPALYSTAYGDKMAEEQWIYSHSVFIKSIVPLEFSSSSSSIFPTIFFVFFFRLLPLSGFLTTSLTFVTRIFIFFLLVMPAACILYVCEIFSVTRFRVPLPPAACCFVIHFHVRWLILSRRSRSTLSLLRRF